MWKIATTNFSIFTKKALLDELIELVSEYSIVFYFVLFV